MQIHRVPRPESRDAEPHPLVHGLSHIGRAALLDAYGHDDFAETATTRVVSLHGSDTGARLAWLALPDGVDPETSRPEDALGYATISMALKEDLEQAYISVLVHPDHRGQGIGRGLWDAARPALAEHGRTQWLTSTFHTGPEFTGEGAITAESGSGSVDGTLPGVRFALSEGFSLEQCERASTLEISDEVLARAAELQAEASGKATGYEAVSWQGRTPDHLVDGVAAVIGRMSTDAPSAGVTFDEQVWDAERLRAAEERSVTAGYEWVATAALHAATGDVVAYTELDWQTGHPAGALQDDTIVRADHRGHRLGLLIKAANLRRLAEANPRARRVHTWNANENDYMLAINQALGFTQTGLDGFWQRRG